MSEQLETLPIVLMARPIGIAEMLKSCSWQTVCFGLCMRLPGRDGTGRRGTEWHRVPLEIQQSEVYRPWMFPGMSGEAGV